MSYNFVMLKCHGPSELSTAVVGYLDNGFYLHGSPFTDQHGFIYQAVAKMDAEAETDLDRLAVERLNEGRDYLMQVPTTEITVEDTLEAFGFGHQRLGR